MEALVRDGFWLEIAMKSLGETFAEKRVLVTGHTGFKGAWLSHWLNRLGGVVHGYAFDPDEGQCDLFEIVREGGAFGEGRDHRGDLLSRPELEAAVVAARPDFVFHLAAQSLVRRSYGEPVDTLATNVLGTGHLLEAVRRAAPDAVVVVVTSDKCYENREWAYPYRETDRLGGHDVYSASKAAAEMVISSWRRSFFDRGAEVGRVATARGGNVIGGGDGAADRIVPDLARALGRGEALGVRSPGATRPWQHVLDCLSGYLFLARWMAEDATSATSPHRAFNFGPSGESERSVRELVAECLLHWPGEWRDLSGGDMLHEASRLAVSIDLARSVLGWRPTWNFSQAVSGTMVWYRERHAGASSAEIRSLMDRQIDAFAV